MLNEIRVDKAFIGVTAIDLTYGISAARQAEAQVKKALVKAARTRIGLADHSKFGRQSFAYVGPLTDLSVLVTDSGSDPAFLEELRKAGVEVLIGKERSREETPHDGAEKTKRRNSLTVAQD